MIPFIESEKDYYTFKLHNRDYKGDISLNKGKFKKTVNVDNRKSVRKFFKKR